MKPLQISRTKTERQLAREAWRATGLPAAAEIWRGPSRIDGAPIVVIATGLDGSTSNAKTGPLAQTWVLRADRAPHVAQRDDTDRSVCGDCPQRPIAGGACYVATFQGPRSVWEAWQRGVYSRLSRAERRRIGASGIRVRAGAYGDPAACDPSVWADLGIWAGYTHQWREPHAVQLSAGLMASADSEEDAREAWADGWRTFRVKRPDDPLLPGEIYCPSARGVSCYACGLCGGDQVQGKSIAIDVHGARAGSFGG